MIVSNVWRVSGSSWRRIDCLMRIDTNALIDWSWRAVGKGARSLGFTVSGQGLTDPFGGRRVAVLMVILVSCDRGFG